MLATARLPARTLNCSTNPIVFGSVTLTLSRVPVASWRLVKSAVRFTVLGLGFPARQALEVHFGAFNCREANGHP